jgi:hypothetical protein
MPTLPADRNLAGELGHVGISGINAGINQVLGGSYDNLRQFGVPYTQNALDRFGTALLGGNPDTSGGLVGLMRQGYDQANPQLAQYNQGLGALLGSFNAPGQLNATGYNADTYQAAQAQAANAGPAARSRPMRAQFTSAGPAAQARFDPAQAYTSGLSQAAAAQAAQQRARGGPLLNPLQGDAQRNLGQVSGLQGQQQQIAQGLLNQGGGLSAQDLANIQQDTRSAYAARGLFDSNQAIGAEILNTDAARRQRLQQNLGLAQGIDAAGQQQLNSGRQYALGVQGQGQQLSQFNAGQGNQLGQFNAGLLTNTSQFNAGQGNQVGMFNAGQQQQNSQYNAGLGAQVSQFNAGARNNMAQFDAGQQNQIGQFNAQLGTQNNQFNAGAQNQQGQYNAGLLQQANLYNAGSLNQAGQYNAGANNAAQQYNVGAVNQFGLANAQLGLQGQNDAWTRALQLGQYQQQQALNPFGLAGQLGAAPPDYTSGVLGYGSDLFNTNYNSQMSRYLGSQNNNAGLWSAGLGALGTIGGAFLGGPAGAALGAKLGGAVGGAVGG